MKSPRKTEIRSTLPALLLLAAACLAAQPIFAQDPPQAPTPKVSPPPVPLPSANNPAPQQEASPPKPANQTPSDIQNTLRVNVNLVVLPVTVKDRAGHL